jgi:hypothetical protein
MKRSLAIAEDFLMNDDEIVVELSQQEVASAALEVTLLVASLGDAVVLRSARGQRVELSARPGNVRAIVQKVSSDHFQFVLATNQLGYLQMVLLRTYRDGMADVNHVHLEGTLMGKGFDLTIFFQVYKQPLSPEEVAKRIAD